MNTKPKLIILCGPSGSGKSSIVKFLLENNKDLVLSISATTRSIREGEVDGKHYHFISEEEFLDKIKNGEILEYEEVYPGKYYGTLKNHIDDILKSGKNVIFDIDVAGALNIEKIYEDNALTLFIQPPSIEALSDRLGKRMSETPESLATRISKAETELSYAKFFDHVIINEDLATACNQAEKLVEEFTQN